MGDVDDLIFLGDARDVCRNRPTHDRLNNDRVLVGAHLDDLNAKVGHGLWKGAPDAVKATSDRHDTVFPVGNVSSLSVVGE